MTDRDHSWRRLLVPFWLVAVGLLLAWGCGGDDATAPEVPQVQVLASGTVDAGGGQLGTDDLQLVVPPGALDQATELVVSVAPEDHPMAEAGVPVYTFSGLPSRLGAPLLLRFRHGLSLGPGGTLTLFRGEDREAYSGGSGLCWSALACRDSAGWCVAELPRGPLALPGKDPGDVKLAASGETATRLSAGGHFRICYSPSQVTEAAAARALEFFELARDDILDWGFEFGVDGADDIWPLDVVIRDPVRSTACYVTAPYGVGHFQIHPDWLVIPDAVVLPAAHELLHCAQTFYDPRPPAQWGSLNRDRLWLDEATASYYEYTIHQMSEVGPEGFDIRNWLAPLAGFHRHASLDLADYGYGMSQLFWYLIGEDHLDQDPGFVVDLFEHFEDHGSAGRALTATLSPPIASWCVDFQRKVLLDEIYHHDPESLRLLGLAYSGDMDPDLGSRWAHPDTVRDHGSAVWNIHLRPGEVPESSQLQVKALSRNPGEPVAIGAYGHPERGPLVFLGAGVDSLLLADWPAIHGAYQYLTVLASRPHASSADLTGQAIVDGQVTVTLDPGDLDLASLDRFSMTIDTVNEYNGGGDVLGIATNVWGETTWNGAGYSFATGNDTMHIALDPATLTLGPWYGVMRTDDPTGAFWIHRAGGTGLPFDRFFNDGVIFEVEGEAACDFITHNFIGRALDYGGPLDTYLTGYHCVDGANPWNRSRVTVYLYPFHDE